MRQFLLLCVASSLLVGADAAPEPITIDQLPAALRGRLGQETAGSTIIDIRIDERSGDPQYLVRYRRPGATAPQTLRLGQDGKVLDSGLIASPEHPDGSIGTPGGATPQTLPAGPSDGPAPAVPPQSQAQRNAPAPLPAPAPVVGSQNGLGFPQRATGETPAKPAPSADGGAPLNQGDGLGTMQTEGQPARENPPFPKTGSQPGNGRGQGQAGGSDGGAAR